MPDKTRPELIYDGQQGIIYVDLSGFTQLVYHCHDDETRMNALAAACHRLFDKVLVANPKVRIDSFAGDGFLALSHGKTPVLNAWKFSEQIHERFRNRAYSLFQNLGVRNTISLRVGLHVGKVWSYELEAGDGSRFHAHLSDDLNLGSRIVESRVCRRFGTAMTRAFFRRLLRIGNQTIREPDDVIQDRNKYPEPLEVYRLTDADREQLGRKLKH